MGDNVNTSLHTQTVDYTYIDTLTYNVSLYIVNSIGCHSDTAYRNMKVYPNPIVNAGNDTTVLTGTTTRMKAVVSGVETQYLWTPDTYFNNGNNTILAPLAVNITNDITYTLQVFARGGCMRMDQVYIKVLKDPVISNTFTPNGDGINDKWEITYLKDFPNSKVQVFTKSGQKIFESTGYGKPWDGTYNGKPLPLDTYYYIIEPGNRHDPITGYITILK
jgi:gliding motility-associated-like protein